MELSVNLFFMNATKKTLEATLADIRQSDFPKEFTVKFPTGFRMDFKECGDFWDDRTYSRVFVNYKAVTDFSGTWIARVKRNKP